MRMIKIETLHKGIELINPEHITGIRNFEGTVMVSMSNGTQIPTKFTTPIRALYYIERASVHDFQLEGE